MFAAVKDWHFEVVNRNSEVINNIEFNMIKERNSMPRSFVNGTWTSQVAAKLAESFKDTVKGEILQVLSTAKNEGATDQELEKVLGRPGNTVRPARVDLANKGFVVDSGKWRHTLSQRPAIVWVLTQYAADAE